MIKSGFISVSLWFALSVNVSFGSLCPTGDPESPVWLFLIGCKFYLPFPWSASCPLSLAGNSCLSCFCVYLWKCLLSARVSAVCVHVTASRGLTPGNGVAGGRIGRGTHGTQCPGAPLLLCLAIWWVQSRTCLFVCLFRELGGQRQRERNPQADSLRSAKSNTDLHLSRASFNLYFPNHKGPRWFLVIL